MVTNSKHARVLTAIEVRLTFLLHSRCVQAHTAVCPYIAGAESRTSPIPL